MDREELTDDQVLAAVAGVSLITPDRLRNLLAAVRRTDGLPGDMAELGVYRGGSARVIAHARPDTTLHLFDTFAGLPYTEALYHNPTGHDLSKGRFACDRGAVETFLHGCKVVIHEGLFPESAWGIAGLRFSFVHVDCDLYVSARDAIAWFWRRMVLGGIMFFDDYGCDFTGVTDAVDEAFHSSAIEKQREASNGITIGCLVVKRG
jgi:hypothetical protein